MRKFDYGNDYVSRYKLDHSEHAENKVKSETEDKGAGDNGQKATEAAAGLPAMSSEATGEKSADQEKAEMGSVLSDTTGRLSKKKRSGGVRGDTGI